MGKATVLLIFPFLMVSLPLMINGSVLLWSSKNFQVPPTLQLFGNAELQLLLKSLNEPELYAIEIATDSIPQKLQDLIKDKHSAYVPNAVLNIPYKLSLTDETDYDSVSIDKAINQFINDHGTEVLGLITFKQTTHNRIKREAEEGGGDGVTEDGELSTENPDESVFKQGQENVEPPTGPQIYSAQGKAIIYSSGPLIFKSNETVGELVLGKSSYVSVDHRESSSKISVTIPLGRTSKVILLFRFIWSMGYWTLNSVELDHLDPTLNNPKYQLVNTADMTAPREFSYHCTGTTVFTDGGNILKIFDIQVQPESQNGRFGDAYDCVPFTTAPIWSGLLISSILGLGLALGLVALGSIKTMDKFDNHKTKQLTITVSE